MTKILDATITIHYSEIEENNDYLPIGRVDVDQSMNISLRDLRMYIGDRSYIKNGDNILQITEGSNGEVDLTIDDILRLKLAKDKLIPAGDGSYDLGRINNSIGNIFIKGGLVLGDDLKGDIYYRDSNILKRLSIGSDLETLTVENGLPVWKDILAEYEETDPVFIEWKDNNEGEDFKVPYWFNNNLKSSPISLESEVLSEYVNYVYSQGGTIQDYETLALLLQEQGEISSVRIDAPTRITNIPNNQGNFVTELEGLISKRSIEEVQEDLDINNIKHFSFIIDDWNVTAGGFYIDFYHEFNSEVITEVKDNSNKKLLVDTKILSNESVRLYVPYDYRFNGTIKITK